jgi:hypothetical protein
MKGDLPATIYPESSRRRPRKTVFFHLLKTGGITFRGVLASIYGDAFHVCDNPSIESVAASLEAFDAIEFHALPWNGDFALMHGELVRERRWDLLEGADVFTMFREPVDQVISLYFHTVRKRAYVEAAYAANNIPFPASLEAFTECPWHLNNQLAFLTGNYRFATKTTLSREDVTAAKSILLRLRTHVGLMERYSDSLHIFETVTGRQIHGRRVETRNRNTDRPVLEDIPAHVKARIRERSALDMELYEFARELFAKDLAACGPAPEYIFTEA